MAKNAPGDTALAAAIDAALIAAYRRFNSPMRAVVNEMRMLPGGRPIRDLEGTEAVRFLSMMLTVNTLALARKQFAWDCLEARLERTPAPDSAVSWPIDRRGTGIQRILFRTREPQ